MDLIVFTDAKSTRAGFRSLSRSRTFDLTFHPTKDFRSFVKNGTESALVYLDVSGYDARRRTNILRFAGRQEWLRLGVIDPSGVVHDVAALFHNGMVDYIGRTVLEKEISTKRIKKALEFKPPAAVAAGLSGVSLRPSGDSWEHVTSGREYTFCCMFVELDLKDEWRRKSGKAHMDDVAEAFKSHIERAVQDRNGKIWMWMGIGGIVLFPFDGTRCDPILLCTRLVLNRPIISATEFEVDSVISYRIVLHIGNLKYQARGDTGTIVSDTLNFLFHLGQQRAEPGDYYLTETAASFIPSGLESSFLDAGSFDGVALKRLRRPVPD